VEIVELRVLSSSKRLCRSASQARLFTRRAVTVGGCRGPLGGWARTRLSDSCRTGGGCTCRLMPQPPVLVPGRTKSTVSGDPDTAQSESTPPYNSTWIA
jgi:hypothetical protein